MKLNGSKWLSAKNCKDRDIVKFLDEGTWRDSTKFTYEDGNPVRQLVFKVEHEGEEKQLSIIKPSKIAMIEAFGDDTLQWVGQKAKITLVLNTQGSKSIVLEPIREPGQKPGEQRGEQGSDNGVEEEISF